MQPKIMKVTFMDTPQLIGEKYTETVRWIRTEMISMLEVDKQTGYTILTYGAKGLLVKEAPEIIATVMNGGNR